MKKLILFCIFCTLLTSCISARFREITPSISEETKRVGTVEDYWYSFQPFNILPSDESLETKALERLEAKAREAGYGGSGYTIRDISVEGKFGLLSIFSNFPCFTVLCNFQTVVAHGSVLQYKDKDNVSQYKPQVVYEEKLPPVRAEKVYEQKAPPVQETRPAAAIKPGKVFNLAVVETEIDQQSGAAKELTKAEVREITTELRRQAVNYLPKKRFNVMTSETVQAQGSAVLSDCAEENCVITLGAKIGADYIVRGTIGKFQKLFTLSVEIYDTEDGNLVASSAAVRSEKIIDLLDKSSKVCEDMYRKLVEELR